MPSQELPKRNPPPPGSAEVFGMVGRLVRMIRHLTAAAGPNCQGWAQPSYDYVKLARQQVEDAVESLVRYCPECGSVGPVRDGARDCCPDGGKAEMVPGKVAEQAAAGFRKRTYPHPDEVQILRDHAAWCEQQPNHYRALPSVMAIRHAEIVEALVHKAVRGDGRGPVSMMLSTFLGRFASGGLVPGGKASDEPMRPGEFFVRASDEDFLASVDATHGLKKPGKWPPPPVSKGAAVQDETSKLIDVLVDEEMGEWRNGAYGFHASAKTHLRGLLVKFLGSIDRERVAELFKGQEGSVTMMTDAGKKLPPGVYSLYATGSWYKGPKE